MTHDDDAPPAMTPRTRRIVLWLLIPAVVLTALGMALLWPSGDDRPADGGGVIEVAGRVEAVTPADCPEGELPEGAACGTVTVLLTDEDRRVETDIPSGPGAVTVAPGDDVVLLHLTESFTGREYTISDHQRGTELWLLGAAVALAVIAFGRWRGLRALAGLAVTFAVLLIFVVPAILDGRPPLLVAVVGAAAIMLTVLYLTHGITLATTVAVAGTLIALTITALLSALATRVVHLNGVADEATSFLSIAQSDVNMQGLLLAGIVIGALGVLDDVTVTQAETVRELAVANPGYGFRQLYGAATRVGRAHIASVVNTIVLAYAGASLPLMLLFAVGDTPVSRLLTGQPIAEELVRSGVGTLGLIAAVPITTALAAFLTRRSTPVSRTEEARPAPPGDDQPWMAFIDDPR
ncbi:YibE/F family protein [Actinoplanes sp. LDG1-06]|uniref:YibE/F family protein n=1 Tax=Paractinoplanes ovalisporus TaxID=2810368 RepID=A0ABS2AFR4_9ACTN|nr:YibE/F family protein [Actinoplanes ovalisporus]MBM2618656.1 YibE/F family protein [Actinoplanes ovalisporus]